MTITTSPSMMYFFYYWALAFIVELIRAIFGYRKLKKNLSENQLLGGFISMAQMNPKIGFALKILKSPAMYIVYAAIIFLVSPLTFLFTVWKLIKKMVGYKSKLDHIAEEHTKAMNAAKEYSDDFMKREGVGPIDIDKDSELFAPFDIPEDFRDIPDRQAKKE